MKALVYSGPRKVTIEKVRDPRVERPTDALVRITTTNICGSDLHMYEGRTSVEKGKVLGHENLGRGHRDRRCGRAREDRGSRLPAVQHRVRILQEL